MMRRILLASLILIVIGRSHLRIVLLAILYPTIREATLKADLYAIRIAIIDYTLEKNEAPQSLQDLMNGHYLKKIPTDPFTRKEDWVPIIDDTMPDPSKRPPESPQSIGFGPGRQQWDCDNTW